MSSWAEIGVLASIRGVTAYEAGLLRIVRSSQTATTGIGSAFRGLNNNIFSSVGGMIAGVGMQVRNMGSLLSGAGIALSMFSAPLISGFAMAVQAGKKFETQMLKLVHLAHLEEEQIGFLREALMQLGHELGQPPTELADGLYKIMSVLDVELPVALSILESSVKGVAVGLGEMDDVAGLVAGMMIAFKGEVTSANQAIDIVLSTIREGGAEATEIATNLGRAMATWRIAGGTAEELGAFVARYTQLNVRGAVAVTSALNIANMLIDPSMKAREILEAIHWPIEQLRKDVQDNGLIPTLIELEKVLGSDLAMLTSVRAASGAFILASDAEETMRILEAIQNSAGDTADAFDDYRKSSQFAFDVVKADLQTVGIRAFDAMKAPLSEVLFKLDEFLWKMSEVMRNNPELTKMAIQFALVVAAAGPLLIVVGQLVRSLGSFIALASVPLRAVGFVFGGIVRAGMALLGVFSVIGRGLVMSLFPVIRIAKAVGVAMTGAGVAVLKFARWILVIPGLVRAAGVRILAASTAMVAGVAGTMTRLGPAILRVAVGIVAGFGRILVGLDVFIMGVVTRMYGAVRFLPLAFQGVFISLARMLTGFASFFGFTLMNPIRLAAGNMVTLLLAAGTRVVGIMSFVGAAIGRVMASTVVSAMLSLGSVVVSALGAVAGAVASAAGALLTITAPIAVVGAAIAGLIVIAAGLAKGLSNGFKKARAAADKQFGGSFKNTMKAHGKNIMESFSQGIIQGAIAVVRALRSIAQVITRWLKPGSPPKILPDLDIWGSGAMSAYMDGWSKFDFSVFTEISDKFRSFFDSLVPAGEEGDPGRIAVIENLIKFRDLMAAAMNEINVTGTLSTTSWDAINAAMSGASQEMRNYITLSLQAAQAQERIADIQKKIAAVQEKYATQLKPITDRLAQIGREQQDLGGQERIKELQDIMKDPRASEEVKRRAALEIEQINLEMQQRDLEAQQAAELDPLQQQLELAEREYEAIQMELELAEQMLDLQIDTNELLKELTDLLREKAEKEKAEKEEKGAAGTDLGLSGEGLEEMAGEFDPGDIMGDLEGFGDPLGELDAQLQELKDELGGLGGDLGDLFTTLGNRISTWWNEKVKPAFDGFVNHPFVQEVWTILKDTVRETVDNFNKAKPSIDKVKASLQQLAGPASFVGTIFLALLHGIGSFIAGMGGVLGFLLTALTNLIDPLSLIFEGLKNQLFGFIEGITTGSWDRFKLGLQQTLEGVVTMGEQLLLDILGIGLGVLGSVALGVLDIVNRLLLGFEEVTGISTVKAREWIADAKANIKDFVTNIGDRMQELKATAVEKWQEMIDDIDWAWVKFKVAMYLAWLDFKSVFAQIWDAIKKNILIPFLTWLTGVFGTDIEGVLDEIEQFIKDVKMVWGRVIDEIVEQVQGWINIVTELWNFLNTHVFKIIFENVGTPPDSYNAPGANAAAPGSGYVNPGGGTQATCGTGYHMVNGECVRDGETAPPVYNDSCGPGFHKENGKCVPDSNGPQSIQSFGAMAAMANSVYVARTGAGAQTAGRIVNVQFGDVTIANGMDLATFESRVKRIVGQMAS